MRWDAAADAAAHTRFLDLRVVDETGSTNADLLALARAGEPEGVVLVAEHQTAGRGRRDRRWEDPPGASLLVSVLTRPAGAGLGDGDLHLVPTAMGVAAAEATRTVTGADIRVKWPNDLVVDDAQGRSRKVAGILGESVVERGHVTALVVGIGINVNWPNGDVPADLAGIAGALNHLAGHDLDRAALLGTLLRRFDAWYAGLGSAGGRSALAAHHRQLSATIGRRVRIETPAGAVTGFALDVDDDGHLLVAEDGTGLPRAFAVGDVVHLRSAAPAQ